SMSALSLWRALPAKREPRANQLCSVLRFFVSRSYFPFCGGILDPVSHRFGLRAHSWYCAGPNEVFYPSTHACTYSGAQATRQFTNPGSEGRERVRGDFCRLTSYYCEGSVRKAGRKQRNAFGLPDSYHTRAI